MATWKEFMNKAINESKQINEGYDFDKMSWGEVKQVYERGKKWIEDNPDAGREELTKRKSQLTRAASWLKRMVGAKKKHDDEQANKDKEEK